MKHARKKAMKVLNAMLSEDAQNRIIYDGQDLLKLQSGCGSSGLQNICKMLSL